MPEPLSVALDGTPLCGPVGGIRRFTEQLLQALRSEFPQDQYHILSDQIPPLPTGINRRWWLIGLDRTLRSSGTQVFHGTDFAIPYFSQIPSILTIHDLSPWNSPTPASARVRSRAGWLVKLKRPRFIHTPTEAIRREVIDSFSFPEHRVVAIPHAAAAHFSPQPHPGVEPYFLYLGTLEPRKNLEVLAAAIDLLWREGLRVPLYLAGHLRDGYRAPQQESIRLLGPQDEASLPGLLSNAVAVVYASHYEGFGLPILEAMQCGAPVVASPIAAHQEVAGPAALFAASPAEWAQQMRLLLTDPAARATRVALSLGRARLFSWAATARAFRELYLRCRDEA